MPPRKPPETSVAAAVERDLKDIAKRDPALAKSTLAMSALRMAREMDSAGNSATSKSMCARELRDTLDRLLELAPKEERGGELDDLRARRERRGAATG
jgi:hypothetical protein